MERKAPGCEGQSYSRVCLLSVSPGGLGLQRHLGNLITQGSVECLLSEMDISRHKTLLLFSEASK